MAVARQILSSRFGLDLLMLDTDVAVVGDVFEFFNRFPQVRVWLKTLFALISASQTAARGRISARDMQFLVLEPIPQADVLMSSDVLRSTLQVGDDGLEVPHAAVDDTLNMGAIYTLVVLWAVSDSWLVSPCPRRGTTFRRRHHAAT